MYIHHKKGRIPHQVQIYAEEQEWRSYTWNRCREGAIFVFQHQGTCFHDYCIGRGLQGMQVNFVRMYWLATVVLCSSICLLCPLVIFHPESLRLQNTVSTIWRIGKTRWLFFSVISCATKSCGINVLNSSTGLSMEGLRRCNTCILHPFRGECWFRRIFRSEFNDRFGIQDWNAIGSIVTSEWHIC